MKMLKAPRPRPRREGGGRAGSRRPRFNRRFSESLNYRLKDLARVRSGPAGADYPDDPSRLLFERLVRYLKSDLLVTERSTGDCASSRWTTGLTAARGPGHPSWCSSP